MDPGRYINSLWSAGAELLVLLLPVSVNASTVCAVQVPGSCWSIPIHHQSVMCRYHTLDTAAAGQCQYITSLWCTGAGLLLLLLPVNAWLMSRLGALQTNLMEHKDTRLKMITEILSAIKVRKRGLS